MKPGMLSLSKMFVVLALALSVGGHWAVLQSVAWVSMVVKFSRQDSLRVALSKTFDGRHPCSICLYIAAEKKSKQDQRPPQLVNAAPIDFYFEAPALFQFPAPAAPLPAAPDQPRGAPFEPPPVPPPRRA